MLVHMECIVQKADWKRVLDGIERWGSQKFLAVFSVNVKMKKDSLSFPPSPNIWNPLSYASVL